MAGLQLAAKDVLGGVKQWRIWLMLGFLDIKLRYRRSQLGPFWIVINTAVMIYTMGFLYGHLFKVNLSHYYPYLAAGIVTWSLISSVITESTDAFIDSQTYVKQISLPYSVYILRLLTRNFIIFFHNLLPIIPIILYFHVKIGFIQFFDIAYAMLVILVCGMSYGMVFAILGTRYRDIKPTIDSMVQVIFLLTPVMWQASMLSAKYRFAAHYNPMYQLIQLVRFPLTGGVISHFSIMYSLVIMLVGLLSLFYILAKARHRISFWV